MERDRRSIRAGHRILLITIAIQGLTPDHGSLASPWLFRLVSAGLTDPPTVVGRSAPSPIPSPREHEDGIPDVIGSAVVADLTLRGALDAGGGPRAHFLPTGLFDRMTRSSPRSLILAGPALQGCDTLTLSLCRFRC